MREEEGGGVVSLLIVTSHRCKFFHVQRALDSVIYKTMSDINKDMFSFLRKKLLVRPLYILLSSFEGVRRG